MLAIAFAYPVVLLGCVVAFWCIGEGWWVTAAALYAPRIVFAAPLPFTALGLLVVDGRRLLWTQALAAAILLLGLLGFVLPWPTWSGGNVPKVRLLSLNVNSAFAGARAITDKIAEFSPDVVLLQETPSEEGELTDALRARYPHVQASTQFVVASRFPIVSSRVPDRIPYYGRERSPRFMHYVIASPFGNVAVFNVHPLSPRGVMHVHRFHGLLSQMRRGEVFSGDPETDVGKNAGLRALQLQSVARLAATERNPVLIAGDTNLPGLSRILHENLSGYTDAFRAASWGFGYTFPNRFRFLRLDRVLVSSDLKVTSFEIGCAGVSDHSCVVAEIQRR